MSTTPETIKCPECDYWTSTGAGGVYQCLRCGHIVDRRRSDQPTAPECVPEQPAAMPVTPGEATVTNREEASLLAQMKANDSNLARACLELERELAAAKQERDRLLRELADAAGDIAFVAENAGKRVSTECGDISCNSAWVAEQLSATLQRIKEAVAARS